MGGFVSDSAGAVSAEHALFEGVRPLSEGRETVDGVWVRRIDFESVAR
jgi:hypothetical protein